MKKIYFGSFILGVILGFFSPLIVPAIILIILEGINLSIPNNIFFSSVNINVIMPIIIPILFFWVITFLIWKFNNKYQFSVVLKVNLFFVIGVIISFILFGIFV